MENSIKGIFEKVQQNKLEKSEALALIRKLYDKHPLGMGDASLSRSTVSNSDLDTLIFRPEWEQVEFQNLALFDKKVRHIIILIDDATKLERIIAEHEPQIRCISMYSVSASEAEQFSDMFIKILAHLQHIFREKWVEKTSIQVVNVKSNQGRHYKGLSGLLKTACMENTLFSAQYIELDHIPIQSQTIGRQIIDLSASESKVFTYDRGLFFAEKWEEIKRTEPEKAPVWKENGIYLLTGGAGGLGKLFSREIAHQTRNAVLILSGRRSEQEIDQDFLKEIRELGSRVEYIQLDLSNASDTKKLFAQIKSKQGRLNGIIHCAGVVQDSLIRNKTVEEVHRVFSPKVSGLVNLDIESRDFQLDFFVLFSSGSAVTGNPGQADYAAANSFMDEYAAYRNQQLVSGQRFGQTLSLNWPLWQEGGMDVDEETINYLRRTRGMAPMQTSSGIQAFYKALHSQDSQLMLIEGDASVIRSFVRGTTLEQGSKKQSAHNTGSTRPEGLIRELKKYISDLTKLEISAIDAYESFESFGIESFMVAKLNQKLSVKFEKLSKTIFYEYQSIAELADYLVKTYPEVGMSYANTYTKDSKSKDTVDRPKNLKKANKETEKNGVKQQEAIAIIGVSGRYPKSQTVKAYWENLKSGTDCVSEVPEERWDLNEFYHPDKGEAIRQGKSYCKHGGFLNNIADFDPLFFSISPREAASMDPQERLFLESCWEVVEDAGYTREKIAVKHNKRVGVFAGITKNDFNLYAQNTGDTNFHPQTSFGSVANRVSYVLDLQGPSMPVDTMCSSSLTAIHEACEHIHRDACELAIAGGVNLYVHPSAYIDLCRLQMLSEDGKCKSFGKGGNGFVPGEGVGTVLLKPLPKAIEDGDHVYAIIKSTHVNHGGKTSGYTVPNPKAQAELIKSALNKANIDPRTIGYIEAHGTGTELGDPIEFSGLCQAFTSDSSEKQYCALGSAKSNLGHLEAAAGIAGITKIILQMKHAQIAPSLHARELNPNIDFPASPFYVQQKLTDWKPPTISLHGEQKTFPRRAGVSSFGAGGANAHVILEEYISETKKATRKSESVVVPLSAKSSESLHAYVQLLHRFVKDFNASKQSPINHKTKACNSELEQGIQAVISGIIGVASSEIDMEESLMEYGVEILHLSMLENELEGKYGIRIHTIEFLKLKTIKDMSMYLMEEHAGTDFTSGPYKEEPKETEKKEDGLEDIAYTLQTGREPMEERVCFTVQSMSDLEEKLALFMSGDRSIPDVYTGKVERSKEELVRISEDQNWQRILHDCMANKQFDHLAGFWVQGVEIAWEQLYVGVSKPTVISLPTYPFKRKTYWIPKPIDAQEKSIKWDYNLRVKPNDPMNEQKHSDTKPAEALKLESKPLSQAMLDKYVMDVIVDKLSQSLDLETQEVNVDQSFADYGLDSILGVDMIHSLNEALGIELETISLFDYSSVIRLKEYVLSEYPEKVKEMLAKQNIESSKPIREGSSTKQASENKAANRTEENQACENQTYLTVEPIAIVGISGRYAQSDSPDELWKHLIHGDDLTEEVSRWDLKGHYKNAANGAGKTQFCKRGSFVKDIDTFDPLFFTISGVEASYMDPQQRLFLEESWKALEDAGYANDSIKGSKCGVYVGCYGGDYQSLFEQDTPAQALWGVMGSVIPSRIAYHLDFKGPAIAVDTACSSSLVAIHMACKDIWSGEASMALAGGVFIQTTPRLYNFAENAGMLSPDGQCKSFDAEANGFVPGEGVGVLVLKRMSEAIADRDNIYGVIKGTGVNQDGTTNGITAPSAKSQEQLLTKIYSEFNINPEQIQMVEAHGTGTKLGDPIEFSALSKAFRKFTTREGYCTLGSVKTNLGHSQYAAGVGGVLKVLLSLKNQQIPPSLHFKNANPAIQFGASPFYVNTEAVSWIKSPDSNRHGVVSSFGASGTNAHLVVGEAPVIDRRHDLNPYYLIALSARSDQQLNTQVRNLLAHCEEHSDIDLGNLSYTLWEGRKHFTVRLTCVANSVLELKLNLQQWLETGQSQQVFHSAQSQPLETAPEDTEAILSDLVQHELNASAYQTCLKKLGKAFVQGAILSLSEVFTDGYSRISLPTYPFNKEKYWAQTKSVSSESKEGASDLTSKALHPILYRDISNGGQTVFQTELTGKEFFLTDHHVNKQSVLPGVVYLEMAREAVYQKIKTRNTKDLSIFLEDVVWIEAMEFSLGSKQICISLNEIEIHRFSFDIFENTDSKGTSRKVYCQGNVVLTKKDKTQEKINIEQWKTHCNEAEYTGMQCYEALVQMGIKHGSTLQALQTVRTGKGYALAELNYPSEAGAISDYRLHPSMMDASIQAAIGLFMNGKNVKTALPFAINQMSIHEYCTKKMWVLVSYNKSHEENATIQKMNISLYNQDGEACVCIKGYASRVLEPKAENEMRQTSSDEATSIDGLPVHKVLLKPVWEITQRDTCEEVPAPQDEVLVVGNYKSHLQAFKAHYSSIRFLEDEAYSVEQFSERIKQYPKLTHIFWMAPDPSVGNETYGHLIEEQESGVIHLFRLIKGLLQNEYDAENLSLTVLTIQSQSVDDQEPVYPGQASIHGLVGSLAKEYTHWKFRLIDQAIDAGIPFKEMITSPFSERGNALVYRQGIGYKQQLLPIKEESVASTPYKENGLYVVIGGAGGIGKVWTQYMINTYKAQVVWIGRKSQNDEIEAELKAFENSGGPLPYYVSADAKHKDELEKAGQEITNRFGKINGIIHSAIVLKDQTLAKMSEERFRESLEAKVNISVNIAEVFCVDRQPDFILMFSSIQSFAKAAGQSNYAAGSLFKDSFAHDLKGRTNIPVKVVNWGYWGNVGIVASKEYNERMARAGLSSIEPNEAMHALEYLMANPIDQLALVKGTSKMQVEGMTVQAYYQHYTSKIESLLSKVKEQQSPQNEKVEFVKSKVGEQVKEMDKYLLALVWAQLQSIGMFRQKQTRLMALKEQGGLPDMYKRWLEECLRVFVFNGLLSEENGVYTVHNTELADLGAAWKEWDKQKAIWVEDANRKAQVNLVEATLKSLSDILQGRKQATDIIFPNSSMKLVEGVYKNNIVADYFNEVLAENLVAYIQERVKIDPNVRLRFLEIGAGTGGTSAMLFPKIRPYQNNIEEYCYTDLSKAFLLHAKREYGPENPYLSYQIFNVEKPLEGQEIEADYFDVVIATNVLHATRNICNTLQNARAAMKQNGIVLLNELSDNVLFSHLTFGLLKGWWLYDDSNIRIPGSPGLFPEVWKKVMESVGFKQVYFPSPDSHSMGQAIIVAESDAWVRVKEAFEFQLSGETLHEQQIHTPPIVEQNNVQYPKEVQASTVSVSDTRVYVEEKKNEATHEIPDRLIREKGAVYLKNLIAEVLQISPTQINTKEPLENYGIDSILVVQLTNALRKDIRKVSSTLFFEVQSIDGLIHYFIDKQKDEFVRLLGLEPVGIKEQIPEVKKAPLVEPESIQENPPPREPITPIHQEINRIQNGSEAYTSENHDVAIIGLSGQYPQSADLDAFWENLKTGNNCISEIPSDRWDWRKYYDAEKGKEGKIYSKWGGFLSDIDKFDPLFFKISPSEAEKMDPQERLFLQTVYACMQDAGYTPTNLSKEGNVGVFAGVMNSNYPIGSAYFSIANRVSYLFNFFGPSMAIDTACSSSLTAIHMAIESIRSGSSECAIAGGVNLVTDPFHYQKLSSLMMLSEGNECKAFGAGADGFIDGEGVGAILLKPLSKAIADGDNIYGVVKGSSINSGGKTNGYTVPNPLAQAKLIDKALSLSKVNPRTISYIEAHGTGTALGDPIEVAGLTKAFETYTQDKGFCSLGSVKSNIGHSESAAGMAGLTKILLQMKHKKLVPSLHAQKHNPEIDFLSTPFTLQQELADWKRPLILENGIEKEYPRRAGISSFGAGGANAHLIVEEYSSKSIVEPVREVVSPQLFVLSAKTKEQLKEQVVLFNEYITKADSIDTDLFLNMVYTLQTGREEMDERMLVIARTVDELRTLLQEYLNGTRNSDKIYSGEVNSQAKLVSDLFDDEDFSTTLKKWIAKNKYELLAKSWINGCHINWKLMHSDRRRKLSLPSYPFAKESYWMQKNSFDINLSPKIHPKIENFDGSQIDAVLDELMEGDIDVKSALSSISNLEIFETNTRSFLD